MTAEVLEPEIIEGSSEPVRSMTVVAAEPRGLAVAVDPVAVIELATRMATALRDIVERQRLFAVISGKKFPQVEAWMTIARMDNVVAREVADGVKRHEDGSYEASVELIRLSDGMVIGRASALCGVAGDKPWDTRTEPQRRSMAVTRATSRAFRQQYSWIMALAGYEPTPAEEMVGEAEARRESRPARTETPKAGEQATYAGTVSVGDTDPVDLLLRQGPEGPHIGFRLLLEGGKRIQAVAEGTLADALALTVDYLAPNKHHGPGIDVTVSGTVEKVAWTKDGKKMPPYTRLHLERIETPDWILPAGESTDGPPTQE